LNKTPRQDKAKEIPFFTKVTKEREGKKGKKGWKEAHHDHPLVKIKQSLTHTTYYMSTVENTPHSKYIYVYIYI